MASISGEIRGTTSNKYINCVAYWSATTNDTENYSTVSISVYYYRTNTGYTTDGTWNGTINCNGEAFSDSTRVSITNSNTWVSSRSFRVAHNADGTKSTAVNVNGSISGTTLSATYLSGTITLPSIPRQATITNAPDFNDEQNPTISYTNKAGNTVSSLQACISLDGSKDDIAYRDISKTGSSYTFNLTDAERKILRAATTSKSRTIKFFVRTVLNGTTYHSSLSKTFSMINANPTLAPTVIDVDSATVALTGNNERIIKYFSNAQFTTGAKAIKESTLVSQKITCGGKSSTAASGTLTDVESGNFEFTATDSRGFTTTQTVKKTIVEYVKLTCNIEPSTPTAQGGMTLTIRGNYFNGGFGAKNNILYVHYRVKENDGTYGDWTQIPATLSGNSYTANITLSGLNYQSKYTFQGRASDLLMMLDSAEKSVKSTPVFDWSKDDFAFNVPVYIQGQHLRDYIFEEGTVSGWNYRKWHSGILECWTTLNLNTAVATAYGNGFYNGTTLSKGFPSGAFLAKPFVYMSVEPSNAQIYSINVAALSKNDIAYYISSMKSQTAASLQVNIYAYGYQA